MTVVAFIIMPAPSNNYNVESLKGQAVTNLCRHSTQTVLFTFLPVPTPTPTPSLTHTQ